MERQPGHSLGRLINRCRVGQCGSRRTLTFHKTILNEFYQVTFRKKIYSTLDQLQTDLDEWIVKYNTERTHQGKMCCGRTPFETLLDGQRLWKEKQLG